MRVHVRVQVHVHVHVRASVCTLGTFESNAQTLQDAAVKAIAAAAAAAAGGPSEAALADVSSLVIKNEPFRNVCICRIFVDIYRDDHRGYCLPRTGSLALASTTWK